jgi:nucleoside 2-deoxyribosyltransferase
VRVYLAGSAVEQDRLKSYRTLLLGAGHQVTSRWLDIEVGQGANFDWPREEVKKAAMDDLGDVAIAEAIVMVVPQPFHGLKAHSGGRHVEVGFAIALGKLVVIVGTPENIFERCAHLTNSIEEAISTLAQFS